MEAPEDEAESERGQAIAKAERPPSKQSPHQVERRRQRHGSQARPLACAIDDLQIQRRIECHRIGDANRVEKGERLVVAAEEHVLAVVEHLARLRIGKRGSAPAQTPALLDDQDPRAPLGEPDGGAQPGKAGANDDDVRLGHADARRARCAER